MIIRQALVFSTRYYLGCKHYTVAACSSLPKATGVSSGTQCVLRAVAATLHGSNHFTLSMHSHTEVEITTSEQVIGNCHQPNRKSYILSMHCYCF